MTRSTRRRLPLLLGLLVLAVTGLVVTVVVTTSAADEEGIPPGTSAAAAGWEEPELVLRGQVVDGSSGVGVVGAKVELVCGEEVARATTDEQGDFVIGDPPSGTCTARATADGWVPGGPAGVDSRQLEIAPDESVHGLELELYRAAGLSGRVVAGARGVQAATLTLLYLEAPGASEQFTISVDRTSRADGSFELRGLGPGRAQVLAEHVDHALAESDPVFLKPGEVTREVVIQLSQGGSVAGHVYDVEGRPVAGASLQLRRPGSMPRRQKSDEEGAFRFSGVAPGELAIVASAHGKRREEHKVTVEAGDTVEVNLTLEGRAGFGGLVIGPNGEAVRFAAVHVQDRSAQRSGPVTRSDGLGRFWIGWVASAGSRIWAEHPAYAQSDTLTLSGTEEDLELRLKPGGRLYGRVVDGRGTAVAVYQADALPGGSARGPGKRVQVGDSSGSFEIASLAPGMYRLRITAPGRPPVLSRSHEVQAGAATDAGTIVLEAGGAVVGTVLEAGTGEPVAHASVTLSAARIAGFSGQGPRALTDREGRFVIDGLPPGRVSLLVQKRGYMMRAASGIAVLPGESVDAGTILLSRAAAGDERRMQYSGVGMVLSTQHGRIRVRQTFEGAPASGAGLNAGDEILRVDGYTVEDLGLRKAVELIRGETGTNVTLEVLRPGAAHPEIVHVQRSEVTTPGR